MTKELRLLFLLGIITLGWIIPVSAEELTDKVEFHGFGGWAYGQTDGNEYLTGNKDGNYDNFQFGLAVTALPASSLRLNGQFFWKEEDNEQKAEIDYAFAEWHIADALNLRIGKIKNPFGIYDEVYDVGTMRPFYALPQSNYGPSGFTTKAYKGIGVRGSYYTENGWGVEYDAYGGSMEMELDIPYHLAFVVNPNLANVTLPVGANPIELYQQLLALPMIIESNLDIKDVGGGRIVGHTPFNLSLGVSAFTGNLQNIAGFSDIFTSLSGEQTNSQVTIYNGQLEYIYKIFTLRSEYGFSQLQHMGKGDVAYGEVSLRPFKHWEIAGRYEWLKYKVNVVAYNDVAAPSLAEHKEWAVGLNYWFNSNFVIKLSYHNVDGNRFALPETMEKLQTDGLDKKTQLVMCGSQFSF